MADEREPLSSEAVSHVSPLLGSTLAAIAWRGRVRRAMAWVQGAVVVTLASPFAIVAGGEPALVVVPMVVALLLAGTAWNITRRPPHREPALVTSSVALRLGAVGFVGSVGGYLLGSSGPLAWFFLVVPLALLAFVVAGFWHLAAICRIVGACHARVVCAGMAWGVPAATLALVLWFFRAQASVIPALLGWLALALLLGTPAVALVELNVVRGKLHEACAGTWAWVEDRAPGPVSWHRMGRMVGASWAAFGAITMLSLSYATTRYRSCAGRLVEVDRGAVPSNWQELPLVNEEGIAPFEFSSWQRPSRTPTPHHDAQLVAPDLCPWGFPWRVGLAGRAPTLDRSTVTAASSACVTRPKPDCTW